MISKNDDGHCDLILVEEPKNTQKYSNFLKEVGIIGEDDTSPESKSKNDSHIIEINFNDSILQEKSELSISKLNEEEQKIKTEKGLQKQTKTVIAVSKKSNTKPKVSEVKPPVKTQVKAKAQVENKPVATQKPKVEVKKKEIVKPVLVENVAPKKAVIVKEKLAEKTKPVAKASVNKDIAPEVKAPKKKESKQKIKVLYVSSECQPFCATGGLADVTGSLPKYINNQSDDIDVRVMLPLYSDIPQKFKDKFTFLGYKNIDLSWRHIYCGVFKFVLAKTTYYFLDNEYYFKRNGGIYSYYDDGERFGFLCKAVLDTFDITGFVPDIIHASDWQSALVPIYLKTCYSDDIHKNIKTIYTIHNTQYQGKFDPLILEDLFGIDKKFRKIVEYDKCINLVKGAIVTCDKLTTVSPSYAEEIKRPEYSCGLESIINENAYKLVGILNGIDYEFYNPKNDKSIFENYDEKNFVEGKKKNKLEFQQMLGLPQEEDTPLISIVSRMAKHKGLDLVIDGIAQILGRKVQFVTVGGGDSKYENFFKDLERNYNSKVRALIGYSNDLARKAYAASDIFLMPSLSEPCGLSQMIASKYGSIPIIRETGGLKDTIKDFGCPEGGNGYTFSPYQTSDLVYSLNRALNDYKNKKLWHDQIVISMKQEFDWSNSATEYEKIYKQILGK